MFSLYSARRKTKIRLRFDTDQLKNVLTDPDWIRTSQIIIIIIVIVVIIIVIIIIITVIDESSSEET